MASDRGVLNTAINLLLILGFLLAPLLFAWLLTGLIGGYLSYYEMGINAAANSGGLLYFVLPVTTVSFYAAVGLSVYLGRRLSLARRLLLALLLIVTMSGAAFAFQLWLSMDYPNPDERTLPGFLRRYTEQWLSFLKAGARAAPLTEVPP